MENSNQQQRGSGAPPSASPAAPHGGGGGGGGSGKKSRHRGHRGGRKGKGGGGGGGEGDKAANAGGDGGGGATAAAAAAAPSSSGGHQHTSNAGRGASGGRGDSGRGGGGGRGGRGGRGGGGGGGGRHHNQHQHHGHHHHGHKGKNAGGGGGGDPAASPAAASGEQDGQKHQQQKQKQQQQQQQQQQQHQKQHQQQKQQQTPAENKNGGKKSKSKGEAGTTPNNNNASASNNPNTNAAAATPKSHHHHQQQQQHQQEKSNGGTKESSAGGATPPPPSSSKKSRRGGGKGKGRGGGGGRGEGGRGHGGGGGVGRGGGGGGGGGRHGGRGHRGGGGRGGKSDNAGGRGHGGAEHHHHEGDGSSPAPPPPHQQQQQQQQQEIAASTAPKTESHSSGSPAAAPNNEAKAPNDTGTPTASAAADAADPPPPSHHTPSVVLKGGRKGAPMLLARGGGGGGAANNSSSGAAAAASSSSPTANELLAAGAAVTAASQQEAAEKKKKKKRKKHRKKKSKKAKEAMEYHHDEEGEEESDWSDADDDEDDEEENLQRQQQPHQISATEFLEKLPAQEVSITADTQVTIRRNTDSAPPSGNSAGIVDLSGISGSGGGSGVPMLLTPSNGGKPPASAKSSSKRKKKKKQGKALSLDDPAANVKAARRFNDSVRMCLERGDPAAMRDLLRHKKNAAFCLEAHVLETVMKAYVMAALFEDALYCLRNCALPATLEVGQTERILQCLPQNLRNSSAYVAADMINALCIATNFGHNQQCRTWFLRVIRGISQEFIEEATSARDRICSASCERLVRAGLCVVDARLKRGKKASELIVLPGDQLGCFVPETLEQRGIATGDAVSILPYAGPYPLSAESLDRNMIEATVTNTNPMVLRLQDKLNANLYAMLTEPADGNVYRIDKLANRMGFNRQLAAAVAIATPVPEDYHKTRDTRRPCPQLVKAITAMDENIDRVMRQSKNGTLPRGELTSTAALCAQPIPWSVEDENENGNDEDAIRSCARLALDKYSGLDGLNASQRLAVEGAITNRLTLIQGPPGTGKTMVAIRILQQWARLAQASCTNGQNPSPILATSDSNIAVDNLVEGCASVGLKVVRLGRPEAIRPELLRYCIDRPSSSYDKPGGDRNSYYSNSQSPATINYKERMKQLKSAQIVCCTCIGSGGDMLDSLGPLERVLVDEATQATEPAVVVPLMRGCRQLVLVGDHCQLPPTVLSTTAEEEGHGVPLFSRMVACGVPPYMLDTQYRMHPCIAMFPSDLFYGGLLRNGVTAPERRPLAGFPWPREEFPVAFVPVKGDEMDDGVSKYNEAEAAAACDAVAALMQGGQCTVSDIAVVTPYAAQARLIRRLVKRLTPNSGPPYIEVSSVDGFQGREKEAVVFSAVRSNDYGAIGFTSDWRRVNVSFTRARRALIVIGNDQTLRRGDPDTWMPWLAWADAHGLNMDKPGVPRGRYDPEQLRRVRGGTTAAEMLKDVLARQQAQSKDAEKQQERAEQNARGHITGGGNTGAGGDEDGDDMKPFTLEEDLAQMENEHGNWDDSSDEEDANLRHSVSRTTLASGASSNDLRASGDDSSNAVDIWDL